MNLKQLEIDAFNNGDTQTLSLLSIIRQQAEILDAAEEQTDSRAIQTQVIADIEDRRLVGFTTYGSVMRSDDEAYNWLKELYEELLDAVMYAKAELIRRRSA